MASNKQTLTKEALQGFSISFSEAKRLGITDNDLKGIYEIAPNKFRVYLKFGTKRPTKVTHDLIEAIKWKWQTFHSFIDAKEKELLETKDSQNSMTLEMGFEKYFEYRLIQVQKKNLERSTYEKDILSFKSRYIQELHILDKKIVDIDEEMARQIVENMREIKPVKSTKKDGVISVNTLTNPYSLLHSSFEYYRKELKIIKTNPFTSIDNKPSYKPQKQNYLILDEMHYVLREVSKKNIRFKLLVNLFLELGLRIEELAAIKYSDINRFRMSINISRAIVKSRLTGKLIIKDLKTLGSYREIALSSEALKLIDFYRKFKEACGWYITNDDFIFTSWDDNVFIDPSRFTEEWRKFIRLLGFQNLPLKNLRHSSHTFMARGENNLKTLMNRGGWTKVETFLNTYNQTNLDDDRKLTEKFDQEFRNTLGLNVYELYSIVVGRFQNQKQLKEIMIRIFNKPIDDESFLKDLKYFQDYLCNLYPIFTKISAIDSTLTDKELQAIFVGFKPIYQEINLLVPDG